MEYERLVLSLIPLTDVVIAYCKEHEKEFREWKQGKVTGVAYEKEQKIKAKD